MRLSTWNIQMKISKKGLTGRPFSFRSIRPPISIWVATPRTALYGELIDTAFALSVGETSGILDLGSEGYFVVKRLPKPEVDLKSRYSELLPIFLNERMHEDILTRAKTSMQGIVYKEHYNELTVGDFFES